MSKEHKHIDYFYGFNSLRFIAAMLVVIHHAEQIRLTNGLANLKQFSIAQNGSLAVDFFFVLSGFLITYLLLKERDTTQTISIRQFYTRRALRIWPLYYLLVFLGLFLVPTALNYLGMAYTLPFDAQTGWLLYLFFLPNAISSLYPPTDNLIYSLWSIGVEEQFYIIWAPLFKYLYRYILPILIGIIVFKLLLKEVLLGYSATNDTYLFWYKFVSTIKFEFMAIGGLGALFLFKKGVKSLENSWIFSKGFQVVCYAILASHFCCRNYIYELDNFISVGYEYIFKSRISIFILPILYLWLLLNTALNDKAIFSFRNKWMNKLGEISYGIYMYHIVIIYIVITLFKKWLHGNIIVSELLFYSLVLSILFVGSYVSYQYFERKIIQLKHKIHKNQSK